MSSFFVPIQYSTQTLRQKNKTTEGEQWETNRNKSKYLYSQVILFSSKETKKTSTADKNFSKVARYKIYIHTQNKQNKIKQTTHQTPQI